MQKTTFSSGRRVELSNQLTSETDKLKRAVIKARIDEIDRMNDAISEVVGMKTTEEIQKDIDEAIKKLERVSKRFDDGRV